MAQTRSSDLRSGTVNCIMSINELSYLQQIQGGQQIGEETSASNVRGSHAGNQLAHHQNLGAISCLAGGSVSSARSLKSLRTGSAAEQTDHVR